ncbi:cytochrome P450 [Sinosporangium siamense]|uniref:Cytochrome P450 n=1 Tax=Sinosporangium siamense TaxID=1367973 RepID=A0A919V7M1_9ACTN|nr:cytochrome P450 [Sinosporangium siamense]GII95265.1 cytochrome P450 [Sinosporangium siamense]
MTPPLSPADTLPTERSCPFSPPSLLSVYREQEPIRRLRYPDGHLGWLVTGYGQARRILADNRFSARSELKRVPVARPGADPFIGQPALPGWFVDMDPPEHTRFRRLLAGQFTVRRTQELRPRVELLVAGHLDTMAEAGPPTDLVTDFALPIPSLVICELLGVPYSDRADFQHNSTVLFSLDSTAEEGVEAMDALTGFLRGLIRRRRTRPESDLLSRLAHDSDLDDEELAGVGVLLLTAGHETVASMLGLGSYLLMSHPQWAAQITAPETADGAVEELLRYLTIFHFGVPRSPLIDVDFDGLLLRAGESITISLPAANRDPDRFTAPDRLDLTRAAGGHLAFGYGVHQCIGQNLARMELRAGYPALFGRFPRLRLAVPAEEVRLGGAGFYGVHRLPVTW